MILAPALHRAVPAGGNIHLHAANRINRRGRGRFCVVMAMVMIVHRHYSLADRAYGA
jgi:hypothetical protein